MKRAIVLALAFATFSHARAQDVEPTEPTEPTDPTYRAAPASYPLNYTLRPITLPQLHLRGGLGFYICTSTSVPWSGART